MVNEHPLKFDLILMDIKLPGFGGVHATAMIRVENHPRMPIIAMTASRQPDDLATYLKHGMDDLLPKPFTNDIFEALLRKHLPHLLSKSDSSSNLTGGHGLSHSFSQDRNPGPPPTLAPPPMAVNTSHLAKYDQTPMQSPGTISWSQSPATAGQIQGASPVTTASMIPSHISTGSVMQPNEISSQMTMSNGMGPPPGMVSHHSAISSTLGMNPMEAAMANPAMAMGNSYIAMGMASLPRGYIGSYPTMMDGGVDFGDERPEKRQRLYTPADIGYPP